MTLLAIAGATIFTLLALLHVMWAFSDRAPGAVVPTRHDGEPLVRPSRAQTLAVAAALTLAAYIVLERGGPGPAVGGGNCATEPLLGRYRCVKRTHSAAQRRFARRANADQA